MSCFDTFLFSICDGDLASFHQAMSEDYINRIYKHSIIKHGAIRVELGSKRGHQNLRPIHLACDRGHASIVKQLIVFGSDIGVSSKIGNGPIHMATTKGHWDIVALLLQQVCVIDTSNEDGKTALHLAAEYDYGKVAKVLLFAGANVDVKDQRSHTALQLAKICGNEKTGRIIRDWTKLVEVLNTLHEGKFKGLLKQSGFKKFYINHDTQIESIMEYVAKVGRMKTIDMVVNELRFYHYIRKHQNYDWLMHADVEAVNGIFREEGALVYCLNYEDPCPYFCNTLLQFILDMNKMEEILQLIFRIVSKLSNKNVEGLVLKRQQFVHLKLKAFWNRLHLAVCDDRCDMVEYLLAMNLVNVNTPDETGNSPLFLACIYGHRECAHLLLCYGANIHGKNKYGQTLAHIAIENGMEDFLRSVVDSFRPVNSLDSLGHSPLDVAIKFSSECLCEHLASTYDCMDKEVTNSGPLAYISNINHNGSLSSISLRENAASLCLKVKGRIYPSIIKKTSLQALQILDDNGNSLLHLAAWNGSFETCRGLVERGVDVNLKNIHGSTALNEAISAHLFGIVQNEESLSMIVRLLVEAGADINIANGHLQTPLQLAFQLSNENIIREMVKEATVVFIESAELDQMLSEGHYTLLVELTSKMDKVHAAEFITEKFLEKCAHVLGVGQLGDMANLAATTTRDNLLQRLLQSHDIDKDNIDLLVALVRGRPDHSVLVNGGTVLTYFLSRGDFGTCERLLACKDAVVLIAGTDGNVGTALHIAAKKGYLPLMGPIMSLCQTVDDKDGHGNTAMALLLANNTVKDDTKNDCLVKEIAKSFIERGASIEDKNNNGDQVIDRCANNTLKTELIAYSQSCLKG